MLHIILKLRIFFVIVLLSTNSYAQQKRIGIPEMIHYLAYMPVEAAESLKKLGFTKSQSFGHLWKDSKAEDICMMNDLGQFINISSKESGKGCEIMIMFEGGQQNLMFDIELLKDNFFHFKEFDVEGKNKSWSEETWILSKSLFGKKIFFNRKKTLGTTYEKTHYFIFIRYDNTASQFYDKLEPEVKWVPEKKYYWIKKGINLLLPSQAVIKPTSLLLDSLHITWPGGDWSNGPLRIGEMPSREKNSGAVILPIEIVKNYLSSVSKDRTDSLICKTEKNGKFMFFLVESDGIWNGKPFVSTFFAFEISGEKIIYGDYTSMNLQKGIQTRKKLRSAILKTYYSNIKVE